MLTKLIADAGHVMTIIRVSYSEGMGYSPILLDFRPNFSEQQHLSYKPFYTQETTLIKHFFREHTTHPPSSMLYRINSFSSLTKNNNLQLRVGSVVLVNYN